MLTRVTVSCVQVKEFFGAGTACVVCPVEKIIYEGESLHIPTMDNGAELTNRMYKELTDIQVPAQVLSTKIQLLMLT